jgi:hypothetical protein
MADDEYPAPNRRAKILAFPARPRHRRLPWWQRVLLRVRFGPGARVGASG